MPLCQSELGLQEEQQRSTTAAKQTLLAITRRVDHQQRRGEEGLVRGSIEMQSKKAVLAGSGPDPKTASRKRFSI